MDSCLLGLGFRYDYNRQSNSVYNVSNTERFHNGCNSMKALVTGHMKSHPLKEVYENLLQQSVCKLAEIVASEQETLHLNDNIP